MSEINREATLTCVEGLVLLALDEDTGRLSGRFHSRRDSLAGAVLMDLTLTERIRVEGRMLAVLDATPIGVPYLDRALAEIASTPGLRTVSGWLTRLGDHAGGIESEAIDRLVARGFVRRENRRWLALFRETCHPTTDGRAERDLKRRLVDAVLSENHLSPRDAALVALVDHAGLLQTVLSRREADRASARAADARRLTRIGGVMHEHRVRTELEAARCWPHSM